MKELIGKTIKDIKFIDEGSFCLFETETGQIKYQAEGDCCSHSYFSDIINKDAMVGSAVLEVVEKERREAESRTGEDYVRLYSYTIKTAKGHGDIEFRNDSNGYYGGSCELVKDETNNEQN